jgi:hypothetical protein
MAPRNIGKPKKRGPGRPPKPGGRDPVVSARLPRDLIDAIDTWADQNNVGSRQEAIRRLIEKILVGEAGSRSR